MATAILTVRKAASVIALRRLQAAGGRQETVNSTPAGACATDRAPGGSMVRSQYALCFYCQVLSFQCPEFNSGSVPSVGMLGDYFLGQVREFYECPM